MTEMSDPVVLVQRRERVGIITLNRPSALNALNTQLVSELVAATSELDADEGIGAIVIAGSERAFAAGADIKEMLTKGYPAIADEVWLAGLDTFAGVGTPTIAAVSGLALGGGCELAMACDLIIAADTAQFGQPEVRLGLIPGLGGTQRLVRAIGKAKAMDLVLTGRPITAEEAERWGLVSRVVPAAQLLDTALEVAATIAGYSRPITRSAKALISDAFEVPLAEGIRREREQFYAAFALEDSAEGTAAFAEKRPPRFQHR